MTEVNRILAEKVMGWHIEIRPSENWWVDDDGNFGAFVDTHNYWQPDTNIEQVIECAEKWCSDNDGTYKLEGGEHGGEGKFLYRAVLIVWMYKSQDYKCYVGEGTKEQAITNALLEAVKGEKE